MNEQRVELFIKDRKFSFMIPFNDYVPFKKAEKKIIDLIENIEHTEEQLDDAIVYSALQLAIENEKLDRKKVFIFELIFQSGVALSSCFGYLIEKI